MALAITLYCSEATLLAVQAEADGRTPQTLAALRGKLEAALAEVTALEGIASNRVDLRLLSPCPAGYDTVLGYLAKVNPGLLELMDRSPEATQRDGFWLRHRCAESGLDWLRVDACPWLRSLGIEKVNAYPVKLLAQRFGA